jgi:hypothetical protein
LDLDGSKSSGISAKKSMNRRMSKYMLNFEEGILT